MTGGGKTILESVLAQAGKYLTFKLAAEEYGLEILKVQEIIKGESEHVQK
jgi:chemotaxis signal transduction protein